METPAPLAVPVEIRLADVGREIERVWRLTSAIGPQGILLARPVPYATNRPVRLLFGLPDDPVRVEATGRIDDEDEIAFTSLDDETRRRVARYVTERTATP